MRGETSRRRYAQRPRLWRDSRRAKLSAEVSNALPKYADIRLQTLGSLTKLQVPASEVCIESFALGKIPLAEPYFGQEELHISASGKLEQGGEAAPLLEARPLGRPRRFRLRVSDLRASTAWRRRRRKGSEGNAA